MISFRPLSWADGLLAAGCVCFFLVASTACSTDDDGPSFSTGTGDSADRDQRRPDAARTNDGGLDSTTETDSSEDLTQSDSITETDFSEDATDTAIDRGDVAESDSRTDTAESDTTETDGADLAEGDIIADTVDLSDDRSDSGGSSTLVYSESFESDGEGTRYTSVLAFHGGPNDHFGRTDLESINTAADYTNLDGDYLWAAEDTDDDDGNGETEQVLTLQAIDVSGYTNLNVTIRVGAGDATDPPEDSTYDSTDYLTVQYSLNGSDSYTDALSFRYVYNGDPYNERLALDEDGDGKGEGMTIGANLSQFGFTVPDGTTLTIQVLVRMNGEGEEVAFDFIEISGTAI